MTFAELKKNKKGFALLFSVLLSSLLLTIGLSIFSITLKELSISTASQRSVNAFFAADSGRECALYWDTKIGAIPSIFPNGADTIPSSPIKCGYNSSSAPATVSFTISGNTNYTFGSESSDVATLNTWIPKATAGADDDNLFVTSDNSGPNYRVQIVKNINGRNNGSGATASTTIYATGHDSIGGDRVERQIKETY